jgi:hypothetical protein
MTLSIFPSSTYNAIYVTSSLSSYGNYSFPTQETSFPSVNTFYLGSPNTNYPYFYPVTPAFGYNRISGTPISIASMQINLPIYFYVRS